jgi:uncharacterized protein (TIGR02646 family)
MIQLKAVAPPIELTDDIVARLTAAYISDSTLSVWKKEYIKKALLEMSHGKCCYCERRVNQEGYMHIEHFFPKTLFPYSVVEWLNLLPCCERCNKLKGTHNTHVEPIIHPINNNPKDFLLLRAYRFYKKNDIGETTIKLLQLNDYERLSKNRFKIGAKVKEMLDDLEDEMNTFLLNQTPKHRSRIITKLRNIMIEGQPNNEYSATVATEILKEDSYRFLKSKFIELGFWDENFQQLEAELYQIAFL